jgi:glutathione synthase/RimK-type ligase-like ATP-grasp enzyme
VHSIVGVGLDGKLHAEIVAAGVRTAKSGNMLTNLAQGGTKRRVGLNAEESHDHYVTKGGMSEAEYAEKLQSGEISYLTPEMRELAIKMALAFGPGSQGLDIIVGEKDHKPRALEVNPYADDSNFEEPHHGFNLYEPWAKAFAGYVEHIKSLQQGAPTESVTQAKSGTALAAKSQVLRS